MNRSVRRTPETVGEAIRRTRLALGWSQRDLARRLEGPRHGAIRQPHVSRWEAGSTPTWETMLEIAGVFSFEQEGRSDQDVDR